MIRKKGNILKYHSAFTTVFILFALVSSVLADAEDSADWFPLAVGNSWLYEMESFSVADNDTAFYTGTRLCEITDLLTHETGFPIYEMRTITSVTPADSGAAESYADTTFDYLRKTATELRCYPSPSLDMHDVWISFGMMNTEMAMRMESSAPMGIRLEPIVVVPSGSFADCSVIVYPAGGGSGVYELYYHPGTGLVKTVYSVESYHMTESLANFNVQQQ